MRERISRLAEGDVHQEKPLLLEVPVVEEQIAYGQNYRGDIHLASGNQLAFRGLIYSDDSRVLLPQGTFAGTSIYIPYQVQADSLAEGTILQGVFDLIYNGGELQIPYRFEVMKNGREFTYPLESLDDYAEYAHTHPKDAMALFESRDFYRLPFMEDMGLRGLYDGLRRAVNHQNLVEEFLCGTGAKERVSLTLVRGQSSYVVEEAELKDVITLQKNTWGYLPITLKSDHPAIAFERERYNTQEMPEDTFRLPFTIQRELLHHGKNLARITVSTPFVDIPIELVISAQPKTGLATRKHRERRAEKLEFWKTLLKFISGEGDRAENLDYLQYAWEELNRDTEPDDRQRLYRAAISYWKNDRELAAMILEDLKLSVEEKRREDVDAYCAYLYLQVQVTESWEKKEQMLKILRIYEAQGEVSEFLFLLQLAMDEGLADRPREMLGRIENYYRQGSRSPFLYLEACRIYNRHPDILDSLGEFELQTLLFGARKKLLTEKTAVYVASLCSKERGYRSMLGRILKALYETYEKDEILSGLCSILIKGEQRDAGYFPWFQKGVERDIRLTRLYDYYLYTVPEDYPEAFPREILLYFSYNSPRNPESQLVLYRNLFRFSVTDTAMMNSYRDQLRTYVKEQIHEGCISGDLAEIYSYVLTPELIDDRMARVLPDILQAREVVCVYKGFSEAILTFGEMEEERAYPMHDGKTAVPFYTNLCRVIFTDHAGNRYAGVPCHIRELFSDMDVIRDRCQEIYAKHAMTRMMACTHALQQERLTLSQARLVKKEMENGRLHRQYRKNLTQAYADDLIGRSDPDEDEILECVRNASITATQRRELVEIMVSLGLLTEAGRQVRKIGFREMPTSSLLRLISLTIQNGLFTMDELLLDICFYLFEEGQCDEVVLEYLAAHYNSGSQKMLGVLEEITARKLPTHGMEERLLGQMLFADVRTGLDRVFRMYVGRGVGDRLLIHAYFAVKCDDYFTQGRNVDGSVFRFVRHLMADPEERRQVPLICVLALSRYYAGMEQLDEQDCTVCEDMISELYRRGLTFAWMKNLAGKVRLPESIEQREWIEYHGAPDMRLEIRLQVLPEMQGQEPIRMAMPQVYPGVYVKSYLLFAGEEMVYEILKEEPGRTVTLARDSRSGRSSDPADHSRFAELNRLLVRVQDSEGVLGWQQDVLNYGMQEAWTEQLFVLDKEESVLSADAEKGGRDA